MLDEIKLFVRCGGPKIVPDDGESLALLLALFVDHEDTGLLPEWRVGQHHVEPRAWVGAKTIVNLDRWRRLVPGRTDYMKKKIHRAQPRDNFDQLDPVESVELQLLLLILVQRRVRVDDVVMSDQQKSARAARGVADLLA